MVKQFENNQKFIPQQQRPRQEHGDARDSREVRENRDMRIQRDSRDSKDIRENRDSSYSRGYQRSNWIRQNIPTGSASLIRSASKIKAEETIDDIKLDIERIEKEINLEIQEIKSMRLGL